jgi:DNA-binding CsgD family transcriptional regulator
MKLAPKLIGIHRISAFELDPSLTGAEAIVLRALVAGQTDRHVCNELRMSPVTFLRIMRGMRGKIGTTDNVALIEWANRHVNGVDQRIDRPERSARPT